MTPAPSPVLVVMLTVPPVLTPSPAYTAWRYAHRFPTAGAPVPGQRNVTWCAT